MLSFCALCRIPGSLVAGLLIASIAACGGEPIVVGTSKEPKRHIEQEPPPAAPLAPREIPGVKVLYEDSWFGAIRMIGIDLDKSRVMLRLEGSADERYVIDTVDIRTGQRVDRWEANKPNAKRFLSGYPKFQPLTGTFEEDLVRFASLLDAAGPWHMREQAMGPAVAVTADRKYILFGAPPDDGSDGDWLYVVDGTGHRPRRIDSGLRASYAPVFSPSGLYVAWQGCESSPCDYGLFVTQLGGTPRRVKSLNGASPPVWSNDGKRLLAMGKRREQACLHSVEVGRVLDAKVLHCVSGLDDVNFAQDAEGRTGVLSGTRGVPGKQTAELHWILLETGEVLARHKVPGASGYGIVSNSGMLAMSIQRGGIAIVDLITGARGDLGGESGWFSGIAATRWVDEDIVLLRKRGGHSRKFQLVRLNAREITERPAVTTEPSGTVVGAAPRSTTAEPVRKQ